MKLFLRSAFLIHLPLIKNMKLPTLALRLLTALVLGTAVSFVHAHDKSKSRKAGPHGGRIISSVTPHAEFFVTPDRKVKITFLDDAGKAIDPAQQVVTVTAGERLSPTKMNFTRSGQSLISDVALPNGNDVPAVVQIKQTATAKPVTERITVDLSKCPDCKKAEYACVCH